MGDPLVSVILPIYNQAHLLPDSMQSIRTQSYPKWELIIVDDGSGDAGLLRRTVMLCADKRIRLIHNPHREIVHTRMTGYKAAKGDLLAVQDADDLSMPDRLEKAVDHFSKHKNTDVFIHGTYVSGRFDPNTLEFSLEEPFTRTYRPCVSVKKEALLKSQSVSGHPIFRKQVIKKCPLREETKYIYDWSMHLDWMYSGFKYHFENQGLYEYVRRENSASERYEREGKRREGLGILKGIMKEEYGAILNPIG